MPAASTPSSASMGAERGSAVPAIVISRRGRHRPRPDWRRAMRTTRANIAVATAIALVLALAACATPSPSGVTSVTIDGGDRTIVVGDALTLTATVDVADGVSDAVAWESSDETVAVIDGVGTVTGLSAGVTEVTATSTVDPGKSDTIALTVDPLGALRWTRQFGTSSDDEALGVASDAHGNVYAVGSTVGALEGANAGSYDAFVRSFDSAGVVRWTRQFGTENSDIAAGVATDASGNVYVTGRTFGALEGSNAGASDAFVRSFDSGGTLRWTRQFGTGSVDAALGVATDANGNVYIAGFTLGSLQGTNAGGADAFVRSYDGEGTLRWTRQFGTSSDDIAFGVAADASGHIYVAGRTAGALEGSSAGNFDAFVRSYDADGILRWTSQFGSSSIDGAAGVATDATGNVYVAGFTQGALEGANSGMEDAFVRSYDGDGGLRWTRQFGTGSGTEAFGVAADPTGNVYVAGATGGDLEGGGAGIVDAFVRSYDGDGELRWTRQFGTSSSDRALGVATDASGNVYASGYTFGALEGANAGHGDAFVRKYGR
ncbi:MAG: hypothetical protein EA416_00535 [Trueperaceae bacterium]|nr:MAG: hypothetical protein EA416_00535 [Trueperaceae bacterium]